MATIKTSCPRCGDVDLTAKGVTLSICSYLPWSYYSFTCPKCHEAIDKSANETVIGLLRGGGVKVASWHVPAEFFEPRRGEPISRDDLLEFHEALESEDLLVGRVTQNQAIGE